MRYNTGGYIWLIGISLFHLVQETVSVICKTKPQSGSLLRFSYKDCSHNCCGDEGNQYCCVVSKAVIIGCSTAGVFFIIVTTGVVCYLISRSRKRRYQRSIRKRPRSVSAFSQESLPPSSVAPHFSDLEVRRFSQLSGVSMPSRIYHVPVKYKPSQFSNPVRLLAMSTVSNSFYKKPPSSELNNHGFQDH